MHRITNILALSFLAVGAASVARADDTLVWHVESATGESLDSREADVAINPASLVKVATTLWALERLGPDHRFETRFAIRGSLDADSGVLDGDLLVHGGGDPDFHVENAYLVASFLNAAGLRTVRGGLYVDDRFWLGWEGGSDRVAASESREIVMASRLRDAFDPARWSGDHRKLIAEFRARADLDEEIPVVRIEGSPGVRQGRSAGQPLAVHLSNPLPSLLKRFNAFSNNDIERLAAVLGAPEELARGLRERWSAKPSLLRLETFSGLGTNRMTPRLVVRLLRELDRTCDRLGLRLEDLLAANGCDPGTLTHFPRIASLAKGSVVAKTGTLVRTDEGIAVLAGVANTAEGRRFFCVAAPRSGARLAAARSSEERWLLGLFESSGGAKSVACGARVEHSDAAVSVVAVPAEDPRPATTRGELPRVGPLPRECCSAAVRCGRDRRARPLTVR